MGPALRIRYGIVAVTKKKQRSFKPRPEESQVSLASTVFWLLCVLGSLVAQLIALVTFFLSRTVSVNAITTIHHVCLVVGLVLGMLALAALPVVRRVRATPPPTSVVAFSAITSACAVLWAVVFSIG